jgi:uncharacterized protein YutE (UPF0331/DUF86 family)
MDQEDSVLLSDAVQLGSLKYHLIIAIQAMIDICNHIVTRRGARAPQDYADCFAELGRLAGWKSGDVHRLMAIARFRNLLVHLYWQVNDQRVLDTCRAHLEDFRDFEERLRILLEGSV